MCLYFLGRGQAGTDTAFEKCSKQTSAPTPSFRISTVGVLIESSVLQYAGVTGWTQDGDALDRAYLPLVLA